MAHLADADLATRADAAAKDLQALAHDITRIVDVLPRWTPRPTRELLEQQARRALAIAAALRVEAPNPDPKMTRLLLKARTGVAVLALAAISHLTVGALEGAGNDAREAVAARAERILGDDDTSQRPPPTSAGSPAEDGLNGPNQTALRGVHTPFGDSLRSIRGSLGISQKVLADHVRLSRDTVQRWESEGSYPRKSTMDRLLTALADLGVSKQEIDSLAAASGASYAMPDD